ncbi:MAG: DUF1254 domain-containing protein [Desulfobacterales bacterium]
MKPRRLLTLALAGLMALALTAPVQAKQQKSFFEMAGAEAKYKPGDFKQAPENIKTRYGTLKFPDGYPTEKTVQKAFDELDLQRATQLYLDMYPAMSAHGLMKGWVRDLGMRDSSHISVTANRLDSSALVLTGNTESLYAFVVFDLKKDGPTVFEVPPGVMGPLDDHNFLFVADIGPTGKDRGQGGKYLLLPPDFEDDVPDGYFVVRSPTYANFSFIRANAAKVGFGEKALEYYRKHAKVYPLKSGPRPPVVKNVTNIAWNSLVPEDASAFEWMHEIINYEPAEAFGKELLGRLASVGIVQDKPFNPDARMQKIFEQAAQEGVAMSRVIAFDSRQPEARVYPNRMWESPFIGNSSTFDPQGYFNLEARTTFHFTADGITPAMAMQMPEGKGSRYQTTYKDGDGNYLDGSKTYKLTMPPKVPVALFWSVTLYDSWTRSELQSRPYPSISSQQTPAPQTNADGSIDIYFAPEKPKGIPEQNWVPTMPDRGFFAYIRYYGPLKAFNDKTWVPNDVELVK